MAKLEDAELLMSEEHPQQYANYLRIAKLMFDEKRDQFDQIRYMVGLSNSFIEYCFSEEVMFVGGLGILGNLIMRIGDRAIEGWRGTRDIDLVLKRRDLLHKTVGPFFDVVETKTYSSSIGDKAVVVGYSNDICNKRLERANVDVYLPQTLINGRPSPTSHKIHGFYWDSMITTDVFGIPVNFLSTLPLLELKLDVSCSNGNPRTQDWEDIVHLIALAEMDRKDPSAVKNYLSGNKPEKLERLIREGYVDERMVSGLVMFPSIKYLKEILL